MTKDKGGRPTKYKPEYAEQAKDICRWGGFSQAKLAKVFGVDKKSITNWRKEFEDFDDAIRAGMDRFNMDLAEKSLLKLVKGFRIKEKKYEQGKVLGDDGKETVEMVLVEERTKQIPPNVRAIETFLRSRDPERWPSKQNIELTGKNGTPVQMTIYTGVDRGPGDSD